MQRIFDNNQRTRVFRDKEATSDTIRLLVSYFQIKVRHEVSSDIVNLLNAYSRFDAQTSQEYQEDRDSNIKDSQRLAILNQMGKQLIDFKANTNFNHGDAIDAYEFTVQAVNAKLKQMRADQDTIFSYYNNHDNLLKEALSGSPSTSFTTHKQK